MRLRTLALASIAAAAMSFSVPATANSLTFQDVTFETSSSGNILTLIISNALNATGNWTGINYLQAFEIKDIGNVTGASLDGWTSTADTGLAANELGCNTGGTPGACFSRLDPLALSNQMSFEITFFGTSLNFDAPSLKVQFLTSLDDTKPTGDLLSQTIPVSPVPEPEIYAMMAIGLGLLGWGVRRKKLTEAAAV